MLIHPLGLDGHPGLRSRWCSWSVVGALLLAFLLEHLASWSVSHQGPLPQQLSLTLLDLSADARIYQDSALFEPWQPWTQALMQEGWWQLLPGLVLVLLCAAALESDLGWAAMLSGCLAILPVSALGAVAYPGEPGVGGLACGLSAMVLARRPGSRIPWVFSYYAVVEIGQVRLFTMPLSVLMSVYLVQDLLRCIMHQLPAPLLSYLLAAVVGAALGFSSRWIRPLPD